MQREVRREGFGMLAVVFHHGIGTQRCVDLLEVKAVVVGHDAAAVGVDHLERAVDQVAELVAQLRVVARLEALVGELGVLAQDHLAQQVVAQRVGAEFLDIGRGVDERAGVGLADLARLQPPAVDEQVARQFEVQGHEHDGPVDAVGGDEDVLADDLHVGRPAARALGIGEGIVVGQRVEPDVGDVVFVEGQRDAPGQPLARARDAQVGQRLLERLEQLVAAEAGHDPVGMVLEVLEQARAVGLEPEIVVGLLHRHDLAVDLRPLAVDLVLLGDELLLAHGVEAFVLLKEDLALVAELLQPVAHNLLVAGRGGAHEGGRHHREAAVLLAEVLRHLVGEGLRLDALLLRGLLHLLPVLVDAGEEEHVALEAGLIAREEVREHFFIGVPEMRRAVDVVNRGGEKIRAGILAM